MQEEDVQLIVEEGKIHLDAAIEHLANELSKIRAGKASPAMVKDLLVPYYGSPTLLSQVANISSSDSRTLVIQPWEKNMLAPIEKAIFETNMGVTPMNDGEVIRINMPPLTEERRRDLVKNSKGLGEEGKISIRHARHEMINGIKKAVKEGYPEDMGKRKEEQVEKMIKDYGHKIDDLIKAKEKDIMTI